MSQFDLRKAINNATEKIAAPIASRIKSDKIKRFIAQHVKIIPSVSTLVLFLIAFIIGGIIFGENFVTLRNTLSLFTDNTHLLISAVGMTLVIISGGIDLSVGSVAALSTMILAFGTAVDHGPDAIGLGLPMWLCVLVALAVGTLLGYLMGILIQIFKVPPFIATLGGMFFARGLALIISTDSIPISDEGFRALGMWRIPIPDIFHSNPRLIAPIGIGVFIFIVLLIFAIILMKSTKLGRNVYAIGGNEHSAELMGLPVKRTRIFVYTFNGFCSALAGIAFSLSLLSGWGRHLIGMELEVIAPVVIGGSLLTGGIGYPLGSMFGVMTQGIIGKFVSFGNLMSGYAKIMVGVLLFLFIVMQRIVIIIAEKNKEA
ncbi:MAG: sugar ABC transporter permease YjfF [Oscillospiraceae bacterium]|nr:sugar ABC transporter permease YjfF [Oscillospiraceae bacterium]